MISLADQAARCCPVAALACGMAVLTALALVFGAGRSAGHHPLGGRLGCVAGLPAGVEAARRAAVCVFSAWVFLLPFPSPPPPSFLRSALRWAFSAAPPHCSTCCRRRRRKHRHHKKAGKPASRNAIIRRLLISCYGESSLETYPRR